MIVISRFSGKCDFYDCLFMSAGSEEEAFEKFKGTKLFKRKPPEECEQIDFFHDDIGKNWIPIHYESLKDLAPYYPYIISFSFSDGSAPEDSVVVLTDKSFVDIEEERTIGYYMYSIRKAYNKAKRNKIRFNKEETLKNICWYGVNREPVRELIDRVEKFGKKANADGVHLDMAQHYRKDLQEEIARLNAEGENNG